MRRLIERYGKYVIWLVVIGFVVGGIMIFTPGGFNLPFRRERQGEEEALALMVNGDRISKETFERAYNNLLAQYERWYAQFGQDFSQQLGGASGAYFQLQLQSQVAENLIRQTLLNQEAQKRRIRAPKAQVNAQFKEQYNSFLKNNQLTEKQLLELLQRPEVRERFRIMFGLKQGTLSEFKQSLRKEIEAQLSQEVLKQVIAGEIAPTDQDLESYFEKNKSKYVKPEQIRASHILLKVAEDAPEEEVKAAKEKIEQIKKELEAGADFAELAKKYSQDEGTAQQGGDLGYFERGRMVPEFEEAAFALQVGQISEPVRTKYGYHIIKLEDRKEGESKTLADVKDEVSQDFIREEKEKRFEDWLTNVKDKSVIEIKLPVLKAYFMERTDPDKALAEYERLAKENLADDRYINYYIARLYETKLNEAKKKKAELEKEEKEGEGKEKEEELTKVNEEIELNKQKLVENLLQMASWTTETEILDKIIALDENNAVAHYYYATLLQRSDPKGAITHLKRALELKPNYAEALRLYGDMMMENKNYREAIENYEKALALVPEKDKKSLTLKLGEAYLGKNELSLSKLREAEKKKAELESAGDKEELAKIMEELEAEKQQAAESFVKAQELFEQVIQKNPDDAQTLVRAQTALGDLYFQQGDYETAISYYKEATKGPAGPQVRLKLGNAYLKSEKLQEAEDVFKAIKTSSPYLVEAYLGLGDVYKARGEKEAALKEYRDGFARSKGDLLRTAAERVLELDPDDLKTRSKLAENLKAQHIYEGAIKQYNAILERDPNYIEAYIGLGESYMGRTQYNEAKGYFKSALALETTENKKIELYKKILEAERNLVGFEGKLGEDGLNALYNLVLLYFNQKKYSQAQENLEKLKQENPEYMKEEVARIQFQLERSAKDKPGKYVEIQEAKEIQPGEGHPAYNTTPPTSGWYWREEAPWGIHNEPIPDEVQVYNLLRGGILIQYGPEADAELIAKLEELAKAQGANYNKLILAPYPKLDFKIALTAWGRIDKFDEFDEERIIRFIEEWANKGPEEVPYSGEEWWTKTKIEEPQIEE